MTEKAVHSAFGKGGVSCPCCNPTRGKRRRETTKHAARKAVRAARKSARKVALSDWT